MRTAQKLTLEDARVMMAAAEARAREIGVDMDIAITDDNGSLLMFHRMDGGRIHEHRRGHLQGVHRRRGASLDAGPTAR